METENATDKGPETPAKSAEMAETGVSAMAESRKILPVFSAEKQSHREAMGIDPKTLAGLCYIPVAFINVLVPLYVLITGKGGRFAKFHAVQALLMHVGYLILMQLVMIPYYLAFGTIYADIFTGKQVGAAALSSMGGMFVMMIPVMLLGIGFLVYSIYLAIKAFGGNEMQVPVIGKYAEQVAGN